MKGYSTKVKEIVGSIWMYNNIFLLERVSSGFSKAGITQGRRNAGREGALQEQAGPDPLSFDLYSYQREPLCQYWALFISAVQIPKLSSKLPSLRKFKKISSSTFLWVISCISFPYQISLKIPAPSFSRRRIIYVHI